MADDSGFWPPTECLTDYEVLTDRAKNCKNNVDLKPNFFVPLEFPYDFGAFSLPPTLNSPSESLPASTESESDEEDLVTRLARQFTRSIHVEPKIFSSSQHGLEKNRMNCGSPKSTLTTVGSWSGRSTVSSHGSPNCPSLAPSPPTSPLGANNEALDLISQEAGQVARAKINNSFFVKTGGLTVPTQFAKSQVHRVAAINVSNYAVCCNQHPSHTISENNLFQVFRPQQTVKQQACDALFMQAKEPCYPQKQTHRNMGPRGSVTFHCRVGSVNESSGRSMTSSLPGTACHGLQVASNFRREQLNHPLRSSGSDNRPVFISDSHGVGLGVKKERNGTGVFLPRRFTNPAEPRKKQGCFTTAMIPPVKDATHDLSRSFTCTGPPRPTPSCISTSSFIPNHDLLMVQRNELLMQRKHAIRPVNATSQEICLPQEWTY